MGQVASSFAAVVHQHFEAIVAFVFASILSPFLKSSVEQWVKRPRIRVELKRVHARRVEILGTGAYETVVAQLISEKHSNGSEVFAKYADRYLEVEVTLAVGSKATVGAVLMEWTEHRQEIREAFIVNDGELRRETRPVLEQGITRTLFLLESQLDRNVEAIRRIGIRTTEGRIQKSRRIVNVADIDASASAAATLQEVLGGIDSPRPPWKPSPSWVSFGVTVPTWHVAGRLTPDGGMPFESRWEESEADALHAFVNAMPGWMNVQHLTVNDGVLIANATLLEPSSFHHARRRIHVSNGGEVEAALTEPDEGDLCTLFSLLATLYAVGAYVHKARLTWPKQSLRFGFNPQSLKDRVYLPEYGSDGYAVVDYFVPSFTRAVAPAVQEVLRNGPGPLRGRAEIEAELDSFWNSSWRGTARQIDELLRRPLAIATKAF